MKRTFYEIRRLILVELAFGHKTINQLSHDTDINWRTVRKHLRFLTDTKDVDEVVNSQYVRIFALTEQGRRNAIFLTDRISKQNDTVEVKINEKKVEIK